MMKEQLIREIEEIRKAQSDLRLRLNAVEDQHWVSIGIGVSHRYWGQPSNFLFWGQSSNIWH